MNRLPPAAESRLTALHDDIDARVGSIRAEHADWPCAKGCDTCCRRLAAVPQLTAGEWELLRGALAALPAQRLRQIARRIAALAANDRDAPAPVTCPLLDESNGACPVYAQRPIACRSYGFYVQRASGLYCGEIEARAAAGALANVVWGNHDAIDRELAKLGPTHALTRWFSAWYGDASTA